jgi:hypothetical protein
MDVILVAYNYGQGAVWAYVRAPAADAINTAFPELAVITEHPAWMSKAEAERLPILDLDHPTGLLADILRTR